MTDTTDSPTDAPTDDHLDECIPDPTARSLEDRRTETLAMVVLGVVFGLGLLAAALPGLVSLAALPTSALAAHAYPLLGVGVLVAAGIGLLLGAGRMWRRYDELRHLERDPLDDYRTTGGDHGDR